MPKYHTFYFKDKEFSGSMFEKAINAQSVTKLPIKVEGIHFWPTGARCKSMRLKILMEYFLEANKVETPISRSFEKPKKILEENIEDALIEPPASTQEYGFQTYQKI